MNINDLCEKIHTELQVKLTLHQMDQIEQFVHFLMKENEITNLTAIREIDDIYLKHIFDSLTLIKSFNYHEENLYCFEDKEHLNSINEVLDIGTGPGFPGIILKIAFPQIRMTLLDSNNKKTSFLNRAVKLLKLESVTIITARAEDYIEKNREKYDLVTSRAVAKLNILLELAIPFLKVNGTFVAMKAVEDLEETKDGVGAAIELNSKLMQKISFQLPIEDSQRTLYVFQKKAITKNIYPRRYDQIKKKPLKNNGK